MSATGAASAFVVIGSPPSARQPQLPPRPPAIWQLLIISYKATFFQEVVYLIGLVLTRYLMQVMKKLKQLFSVFLDDWEM